MEADGRILVIDAAAGTGSQGALFRVDPVSGGRAVLSDFGSGANPGVDPVRVAVETDGRILVIDAEAGTGSQGALFRVDPVSGARTMLSDFGSGANPGRDPVGVAVAPDTVRPAPPEAEPATPRNPIPCTGSRCRVPIRCNLAQEQGIPCTNRIALFVRRAAVRLGDAALARAPRRIRFAFGISNVPPGGTQNVSLRLTSRGRKIARSGTRRLRGVIEIRNTPGDLIDTRPVRIRIRPK